MKVKLQKPSRKSVLPLVAIGLSVVTLSFVTAGIMTRPKLTQVLIATKALAEGELLENKDLKSVQLPLGEYADGYLAEFKPGLVLANSLEQGQLVSASDVARAKSQLVPIRFNNLKPISKAISVGDYIDIWATDLSPSSPGSPEPVAFNALVTGIELNNSLSSNTTSVEVRLDRSFVESVLAATDSRFQISLILHETLADEQ